MVGAKTAIGESTSLKRSIVGKQCVIGEKVRLEAPINRQTKITNSVIMDFVKIGNGCTITVASMHSIRLTRRTV
jgi:ADP-glucose pyrophosphorylase